MTPTLPDRIPLILDRTPAGWLASVDGPEAGESTGYERPSLLEAIAAALESLAARGAR
ncbi:hypothetical protein [Myxococcus landrumensis]|uniref:Type II toxin-antitoxin system HicB family antitoxin n=1 Tax=Myxococcus landrumensis TaxID=2813577 RepID=A0ABX7N6J9_9BACT|nr:hypothetical protein [Myxococcus landrumus]QSQ14083.1 hypothetical protein JY572_38175 [Myxococcus landrumus]